MQLRACSTYQHGLCATKSFMGFVSYVFLYSTQNSHNVTRICSICFNETLLVRLQRKFDYSVVFWQASFIYEY
jgi:hypothetical protein